MAQLTREQALFAATPAGFAHAILGMKLYPKQIQAANALTEPGSLVSFASCNSGGKTRQLACAVVLWHMFCFPKGIVDATSGSYRQLEDQLMPSLHSYKHLFPSWKWSVEPYIETEMFGQPNVKGGFFRGFSTDHPGRAEGDHANGAQEPLLYIVDEAKSCQPWLHGVVEGRVRPTRLLLISSHGFAEGWFYESQTVNKARYKVVTQSAHECPHITKQDIQEVRDKFPGAFGDSILGLGFIPLVEDATVHYRDVDYCMSTPPAWKMGEVHAFCDFAWSNDGDESVLALRNGNKVTLEACFRKEGLHAVCDEFVYHFKRLGLSPHMISGDEGGGGKLVLDELDSRGWMLNRVNNGFPANDDLHYVNKGSEMWVEGVKLITSHQVILPDDRDLRYQLINRKRVKGSKNRLQVETKKQMKERGISSPDRAEAAIACCAPGGGQYFTGNMRWAIPVQAGGYTPIGSY